MGVSESLIRWGEADWPIGGNQRIIENAGNRKERAGKEKKETDEHGKEKNKEEDEKRSY